MLTKDELEKIAHSEAIDKELAIMKHNIRDCEYDNYKMPTETLELSPEERKRILKKGLKEPHELCMQIIKAAEEREKEE